MASGFNRNLRRSQIEASDEIHDFPCTPCSDEDKNTEAVYQCVDCQIFYCRKCMTGHNKFTKDHYVVDNNSKIFGQGKKQVRNSSAQLPSDICDDHHGEVIKMFCKNHDVVCCAVCIAVKHRSCDGVEYIPNISKGILRRPNTGNMKSSLQKVNDDLLNMKIEMQKELKSLNKERDDIMEKIKEFKKSIIARVEELEKASQDELQEQHSELADNIKAYSSKIDDIRKDVEIRLNKLNFSKDVNEAQLFVDINFGEKELRRAIECVETSADRDVKNLSFDVVKEIEKRLGETKSLGKITIIHQSRSIPKILIMEAAETKSDASFLDSMRVVPGSKQERRDKKAHSGALARLKERKQMKTQKLQTKIAKKDSKAAGQSESSVSLSDVPMSLNNPSVPHFVEKCVDFIELEGLHENGIYRIPGDKAQIDLLTAKYNEDANVDISSLGIQVNAVATVLKAFFAGLTDPLVPISLYDELIEALGVVDKNSRVIALQGIFLKMHPLNLQVLKFLITHLHKISMNCAQNGMDSTCLSWCWWPKLFEIEFDILGTKYSKTHEILQTLIERCSFFFHSGNEI